MVILSFIASLCMLSLQNTSEKPEIRVAAAADLARAFTEISRNFETERNVKVSLVFGSTGLLAKQIETGAPFDIFAAADEKYLVDLEAKGKALPNSRKLYATGRLVIVSRPGSVPPTSVVSLVEEQYRRIAIAKPAHAPYGVAAEEALRGSKVLDKVKAKLAYGENVQQTLRYVDTGAADAGIVSLSLVIGTGRKYTPVSADLHKPLRQALAVLKQSSKPDLARQFAEYVLSPMGRAILKRYGFLLPGEKFP